MEKEKDSRLSKNVEKVDILSDVMVESFEPEIPRSQTENERRVESEHRFSAELDPGSFG